MQRTNLDFFYARGAGRAAVGVFVICMLLVSGLFWGGSGVSGKIKVDPRSPIGTESLEGLKMRRLDLSPRFARWNSYYCGTSSYDAAWIGFVGGRDVCMVYKARDNEFWLVKGDLFIPLSTDIIFLQLRVSVTEFIFFGCDEGVLVCSNPMIMPPVSGLDISGEDDLIIETVVSEDASVEPEGVKKLRGRVAGLSNSSWFAKLCYVTDTLRYSDNCQDENAPPMNFAVSKTDLDTRKSFTLTWHGNTTKRNNLKSLPEALYYRDINTSTPRTVKCLVDESRRKTAVQGYQTYACTGHALEFQGNFIVIGSDKTAAASGGTILPLPKPEVHVVAMEITQGLQNWENRLTLVKNRRTVVRVFMETVTRSRKITANLKGAKIIGTKQIPLGVRHPINHYKQVSVKPRVTDRRDIFESSLNFTLPDDWVKLNENEQLELKLVFTEDNIYCQNRCTETVSFYEISDVPHIVMVPLSVKDPDDGSLYKTKPSQIDEQYRRLISIIPLPNLDSDYINVYQAPRMFYRDLSNYFEPVNRDDDIAYYTNKLEILQSEGPRNFIYLGVLPGLERCKQNPNSDEACTPILSATGEASNIPEIGESPGRAAVWYTGGDDNGYGLSSWSGENRNIGGHELGHLFGQHHPIRVRAKKNERGSYDGECGEDSGARETYPDFEKLDSKWKPLLGPLGDPYTEVWGLDTRIVMSSDYSFNKEIAVVDPREIFSIMSYCHHNANSVNQGKWMDSYHHQAIIEFLSRLEGPYYTSEEATISDLISGEIEFSSAEESVGLELAPIFSRPRFSNLTNSGEFTLELRDGLSSVIRSIPLAINMDQLERKHAFPLKMGFSVIVANPPEYASLAVTKGDVEIAVIERSLNSPMLSVAGVSTGEFFDHDDTININWTGYDADGDQLIYRVYYSTDGGANYHVLLLDTEKTRISFQAASLAGSDSARIGVSVSDGTRSTFVETPIFSVAGNVPEVSIGSPTSGSVISSEQVIVLDAFGYDREDGYLGSSAFSWHSNIDGNLGAGNLLVVPASDLSIGEHVITATATDSDQMASSASVILAVNTHNTAPDAIDDTASAVFGNAVQIDVFVNDIDLENDTDLDTMAIYEQPAFGEAKIVISPSGRPVVEYFASNQGTDVFSYEICDYGDRCDTAQITVTVVVENCTITGTDGDDILRGTSGDDVICGLGGDDSIDGRSGNDTIYGGPGDDTIYARAGDDIVHGGLGNDLILGHRGDDIIYGSLGDDIAYGGEGNDRIIGGEGDDELYGEADDDRLEGNDGDDKIHGGRGDDIIWGDQGNDTIRGNTGKDTITPGPGDDTILGLSSEDTVF